MGVKRATRAESIEDPLRQEVGTLGPFSAGSEQAEDELAVFFTKTLDLACIAGFDGYFQRLNPAWTTRLGWTLEELKAKPFLDLVHPDDREATLAEVESLAEGAEVILFENRYQHQDGSYRWLQWNAWPVPGRQRMYATARDVTRQKRLEREVLEVADREKERLGQELHDGLCQTLAGIAALSSTLSRRLATTSESSAAAAAAEISQLLNEAIGEARNHARGLAPAGLNENGLDAALEVLAGSVQHLFRVRCTLECDRPFLSLCREVEAHLFRIAQEAVRNAIAHGRARQIQIDLSSKDGQGLLSVRDDGVGLPREVQKRDGIGMYTMAYRSRLIGGSVEVRRRSGRGTAVICAFPLLPTSDTEKNQDHAHDTT